MFDANFDDFVLIYSIKFAALNGKYCALTGNLPTLYSKSFSLNGKQRPVYSKSSKPTGKSFTLNGKCFQPNGKCFTDARNSGQKKEFSHVLRALRCLPGLFEWCNYLKAKLSGRCTNWVGWSVMWSRK